MRRGGGVRAALVRRAAKDVLLDVLGFVRVDVLVFVLVDELGFVPIDVLVVV